jgi:cysteine-rich repeat protein
MKYFYPFILLCLLFSSILSCGGGGSSSPDLGLSAQNCGNGKIDVGEACDDGNVNNSDGCNAHCAYEVGEATCGNGILENDECCDDGNNVSGDGCSANCTLEKNNHSPSAPLLADEPHDGALWAPTRLYLSWSASTDSDAGDKVTYDVYFILKGDRDSIPPSILPYKSGISSTHFIIQASTDNRAEYYPDQVSEIYLSKDNFYLWKVCARDSSGAQNCSETRSFNTDDSVVGWWRFDENPAGAACPAILGGPAGDPGETVCDYSGKGNHGKNYGTPTWLSPNSNLLGRALQFDGVNDYVEIPDSATLNPVSVSIQSKFKILAPVINGDQEILDKRLNGFGYELRAVGNAAPLNAVVFIKTKNTKSL